MTEQPLHVKIINVLNDLLFSIDRVKNYEQYQSEVYYQDVLRDLISLEQLERQYPKYWKDALARAINMYVNIALVNIENKNQKFKDQQFENVINTFIIFKNKYYFKERCIKKIAELTQ